MPDPYTHRLEARSVKLAAAVKSRVDSFATALTPPGARPPFTRLFSEPKAITWWLDNWNNPETGLRLRQAMPPLNQIELHNMLSQHIMENGLVPQQTDMGTLGGTAQSDLTRGLGLGGRAY